MSDALAPAAAPAAAPVAAPEQQAAPVAATQQAAPEAAPFNPLDIGSVAAAFASGREKMSVAESLPPRDETGKFVSEAAPASDPNPPVPQPDSEPMVEFGAQFGKVPVKDVPTFVDQLVAHRTNEYQAQIAELSSKVPTLEQQLVAIQRQAQEAAEERNQLLAWAQQDPQSFATFMATLPRVPQATQPMVGSPQPAPNQTQGQYLTAEQAQAKFNEFWQAKQAEQQAQAAAAAAASAEQARLKSVTNERLKPIIGSLPENLQEFVRKGVGAELFYNQELQNAPEPMVIQAMVASAQRIVNEINTLNATRVAAQKQIAANTTPPIQGGPVPAPRVDRSGFNPLDFNSVQQSFRAERARLTGM